MVEATSLDLGFEVEFGGSHKIGHGVVAGFQLDFGARVHRLLLKLIYNPLITIITLLLSN